MFRQMPENLQYNNYNQGPNSPSSSPPPSSPFQSSSLSGNSLDIILFCNFNVLLFLILIELGSSPGPDEKIINPASGTQVMYQVLNIII